MQESINSWFEKEGRYEDSFLVTRADNRRVEGWRNVKQVIRIDGDESDFKVFSTCTHFITTFPANVHDEKKPEDLDTNGEDHSADEFRYAVMSRPPETDLKIQENLSLTSPLYKMNELKRRREEDAR